MVSFVVCVFVVSLLINAFPLSRGESLKRAAYLTNNDPYGNSIIAVEIAPDGLLSSSPVLTPTGGKGGVSSLSAGGPSFPDALFTQDSVVVSGNYLFAVNAGSNTLSVFYIDKKDPLHPTLIGKPAATLGEFPTSVAYSPSLKTACVVHDGEVNGVTCFSVDESIGLTALDKSPRHLSKVNQTTPPAGPAGTVSDIVFNPSSTALFVLAKGPDGIKPGYFYTYPVKHGKVSRKAVFSSFSGIQLPFTASFLGSDSRFLVSDPSFGYGIVDVSSKLKISLEVATIIPGQQAVCWTVYSEAFDSVYILDSAATKVTVGDPKSGAIKTQIPFDISAKGAFDAAIDRSWLYFLAGDASIIVIDLAHSGQVQKYDLSSLGSRNAWEGLAIFPSTRE